MIDTVKLERMSEVMNLISTETEADVSRLKGQPFTGKTLGELHGYISASIKALADNMKILIDDELDSRNEANY